MKILVTGGAGFIGSWVVLQLLEKDPSIEVINLDLLTYAGNLDNLETVTENPRYRFVHGDICDVQLVSQLMQEADMCIHAAAETHVDRSITGPLLFTQTNTMGTHILLESARQHRLKKFVMVSTDEVYGELPLDGKSLFTEDWPLSPSSPYSASKAAADMIALSYHRTYDMPVCVTRCGNNYGPHQYPEKLIPFFTLKAMNNESLPVYGDGKNVRDWIHVRDHADAVIAVMFQGRDGEVYNIGADNQRNNLEITRRILEVLEKPDSLIEYVTDRPGHDRRYALDTTKIRTELGWSAKIDFDQGMKDTLQWYRDNGEWIHRVQERQQREQISEGAQWLQSKKSSS